MGQLRGRGVDERDIVRSTPVPAMTNVLAWRCHVGGSWVRSSLLLTLILSSALVSRTCACNIQPRAYAFWGREVYQHAGAPTKGSPALPRNVAVRWMPATATSVCQLVEVTPHSLPVAAPLPVALPRITGPD